MNRQTQFIKLQLLFPLLLVVALAESAHATALDDYVAAPDANFNWSVLPSSVNTGNPLIDAVVQGNILNMNSQAWRSAAEVDHVVWRHWLTVIQPKPNPFSSPVSTALLFIGGGSHNDPAPLNISEAEGLLAAQTNSVVASLSAVPNQPLLFSDQAGTRSEDAIIAYSWDKFLRGGDPNWPVQLPMVKSVVRAMDAIQAYVGGNTIQNFVLIGGSKRGWTAWLTAAVDSRVVAIEPIVSDLLNMERSFAHHWRAYGFWADALAPYIDLNIFDWFGTTPMQALLEIVDPYRYRNRLTMPKFIINATGDDFFVSDSVRFYLDDLPGETYLRHVPNANHFFNNSVVATDATESVFAYYDAFLDGVPRPDFSWTFEPDGSIRVQTADTPDTVLLWQATNPDSRDFRLTPGGSNTPETGPHWSSTVLSDQGGGVFVAQVAEPASGWSAFFIELKFNVSGVLFPFKFSTQMRIVPEDLPFLGDLDRDTDTDLDDLMILADYWLENDPFYDIWPTEGDGFIELSDFSAFQNHFPTP